MKNTHEHTAFSEARSFPLKIVALYVVLGCLWILFSDRVLESVADPHLLTQLQTYKGWLFVGVTAPLLFALLRRYAGIRLRAEELVRENAEQYRVLFDSNPYPLWVYDIETLAFLAVNDAAIAHYGYSREEFLSMTITDIRPPEDVPALMEHVFQSRGGLSASKVWRHRKKNGELIDVEITTHTIVFAGRRAKLVLAYDITERQRLEEQLRHAQKMEAVGQLAGGVAHDFNNILSAIIGYGNLLQMKQDGDESGRAYVDNILTAAERAAGLTKSLLTFSRKQVVTLRRLDMNGLIRQFEKFLQRLIREDIALTIHCPEQELPVLADSGQIEQVLMNLATNANDAIPDVGRLTISTERVVLDEEFVRHHECGKPGAHALISIADTGIGMDEKTREKIFEPFFTTKVQGKGTGLGLAIVYGIIKQHNGFIHVYSERGQGTIFKIYLPLLESGQGATEADALSNALPKGGTETVLVVEDDEVLRRLDVTILKEAGYRLMEAVDGDEAIRVFREHRDRIQLVMLDAVMPKRNGQEVFAEIRNIRPDIRVVFTSGYPADSIDTRCLQGDHQAFIPKPIAPNDLLRKVREVLDR